MSEPKKKHEEKGPGPCPVGEPGAVGPKGEPKTEVPDTKHHYDPVGSLTNPKPGKEALKQGSTSENDALGATAQS